MLLLLLVSSVAIGTVAMNTVACVRVTAAVSVITAVLRLLFLLLRTFFLVVTAGIVISVAETSTY